MKFWTKAHARLLWISVTILVLDQVTKIWVTSSTFENTDVIPGFFSFTLVKNPGAAWGIFRSYPGALTILAGVTLGVLLLFPGFFQGVNNWSRAGWALLAGGIAGNLIDRIRFGHVIDFLDFYVGRHHWPAFNVADAAICAGVLCYVIDSFKRKNEGSEKPEAREMV